MSFSEPGNICCVSWCAAGSSWGDDRRGVSKPGGRRSRLEPCPLTLGQIQVLHEGAPVLAAELVVDRVLRVEVEEEVPPRVVLLGAPERLLLRQPDEGRVADEGAALHADGLVQPDGVGGGDVGDDEVEGAEGLEVDGSHAVDVDVAHGVVGEVGSAGKDREVVDGDGSRDLKVSELREAVPEDGGRVRSAEEHAEVQAEDLGGDEGLEDLLGSSGDTLVYGLADAGEGEDILGRVKVCRDLEQSRDGQGLERGGHCCGYGLMIFELEGFMRADATKYVRDDGVKTTGRVTLFRAFNL